MCKKIKCGDELRVTSALDAVAELWLTLAVCADIENIPLKKKIKKKSYIGGTMSETHRGSETDSSHSLRCIWDENSAKFHVFM